MPLSCNAALADGKGSFVLDEITLENPEADEGDRDLHWQMQLLDLPHPYQELVGGHEWSYWEDISANPCSFLPNS